jgi:hypothetical protein
VGISDWQEGQPAQADLFDAPRQPACDARLLKTIDAVSDRFGKGKLQVGLARKRRE